jgi:hypothetical protein
MFLTPAEIMTLTGYQLPAHQIRWLKRFGYFFEVAASGRPIVSRAYVEARLGVKAAAPAKTTPNFSALKAA